jgi:hypothetical protein
LQLRHDAATFAAGQRGDRQQHLIELLLDLAEHLGGLDRDTVDRGLPKTWRIIEKGHDLVVACQVQSRGELGTGLTGAVDRNTHDLLVTHRPQRQEQITQGKTHCSGETGEQQPEQDPTVAGRHRQAQHHAKARQQQHQQSIAASER